MKEALFYEKKDSKAHCVLCPRNCVISEGSVGFCGVRQNVKGKLYSLVYGRAAGLAVDPVEKKPLFHFLPGSAALSFGTVGCNLVCQHCQNWTTSQAKPERWHSYDITPEEIVQKAVDEHCESIAYTYNEPTIFYEFMLDTAKIAKKKGIMNIMVTNGFIQQEPLKKLCKYIDGANVDIKGNGEFYKKYTGAWIEPVLASLKTMRKLGVWVEIANLIIPTLNDDMDEIAGMADWICTNLGKDTPLHLTAFYPAYKLQDLPATNAATLVEARKLCLKHGLNYVYIGNVITTTEENTYCPKCGKLVIERSFFNILQNNIKEGNCPYCGFRIAGVWSQNA